MAAMDVATDNDRMKKVKEFDESKIGVKGLSDSDITSIPGFFVHPPETLSGLKSSSSCTNIPIIDLQDINSAAYRHKIVEQVKEAAKTWGFFQVINHGVPTSTLEETINAIKAFHNQPHEEKTKYYARDKLQEVMYASNFDLYRSNAATWHDYLKAWMGPRPPKVEDIPAVCRKEMVAWDKHATGVAETVMELLSEGLGLEAGKFKQLKFSDKKLFVGLCYPYCPQPDLTMGLTSHTDPIAMTVLLQNHVPGLQVKHGDEWVNVNPVPEALVVNIGDFLQIISNGEYQSIQHRVLANAHKEARITVIMFFNINDENESDCYGPLPELLSPEKPAIYRNFTLQEYLQNVYGKALDSKSMIEKVKIQD